MLLNHPCVIFLNILLLKPIFHGKIFLQEMAEVRTCPSPLLNSYRLNLLKKNEAGIEQNVTESGKCFS